MSSFDHELHLQKGKVESVITSLVGIFPPIFQQALIRGIGTVSSEGLAGNVSTNLKELKLEEHTVRTIVKQLRLALTDEQFRKDKFEPGATNISEQYFVFKYVKSYTTPREILTDLQPVLHRYLSDMELNVSTIEEHIVEHEPDITMYSFLVNSVVRVELVQGGTYDNITLRIVDNTGELTEELKKEEVEGAVFAIRENFENPSLLLDSLVRLRLEVEDGRMLFLYGHGFNSTISVEARDRLVDEGYDSDYPILLEIEDGTVILVGNIFYEEVEDKRFMSYLLLSDEMIEYLTKLQTMSV